MWPVQFCSSKGSLLHSCVSVGGICCTVLHLLEMSFAAFSSSSSLYGRWNVLSSLTSVLASPLRFCLKLVTGDINNKMKLRTLCV